MFRHKIDVVSNDDDDDDTLTVAKLPSPNLPLPSPSPLGTTAPHSRAGSSSHASIPFFSRVYTAPSEAHERFRTTDGIRPNAAAAVVKDEGGTD